MKDLTPQESLDMMKAISNEFYSKAIYTQCHAFVEFCGLMKEYIAICENNMRLEPEKDFRMRNAHTNDPLIVEEFQKGYWGEKLHCILPELHPDPKEVGV